MGMNSIKIDPMHRADAIRSWLFTHVSDVETGEWSGRALTLARQGWSINWDYDTDLYWIVSIEDDDKAMEFKLTWL